ncbi:hypothetical protein DY218_27970 [Streptomyces triticagri]|uniref:Integral membrane protein n=1 Tax=Streptomyces triticagri TaxID=2293568 RepID=A0A372LXL9_9ACTN|nr:hypothetical protein [Streptomyces triticagri]RFU83408.1 hypothetical protein DY218_27970 [Streptomyces triticagri]
MPDRLPSPSSSEQDPPPQGKRGDEDNPFAPPPEGAPDQPWQPRRPEGEQPEGEEGDGGSRWSSNQPGRSFGGFGQRPGQNGGPDGQGGPGQNGGMRWDPTDPAQRHARFALLAGMWAFFFALFNWPYVALLLGALALNWGIGSLRAKKRGTAGASAADVSEGAAPAAAPGTSGRPQTTAAVAGLVTAGLALAIVAATFTAQLVYREYYTCVNDALTEASKQTCEQHLPKQLRPLLGEQE